MIIPASGRAKFPTAITFTVRELCGSSEAIVQSISETIMDEDPENPNLGRQMRMKALKDLSTIDALVEAVDGEKNLRIDSVLLLQGALDAIRKHQEEHDKPRVGAKRGREQVEGRTETKRTRYEKV